MRTKTCLLASALSCALALALYDEAFAAPPVETKAEADALTDKAAVLYDEGVSLYKRSRWAEARASFLAAWSLKQHWQIAGNLADCELKLERYREAAEHAGYYKRHAPADRQGRVEGLLKAATAKVATVTVSVEPAGAEVLVDGEAVGRAPLEGPVYLDPGEHKIGARVPGRPEASEAVAAAAGGALEVRLAVPEAAAAKTDAPSRAGGEARSGATEGAPTGPVSDDEGPKAAVLIAGSAVAGVAIVTGVILTVVANGKAAERDDQGEWERCYAGGARAGLPDCAEVDALRKDAALLGNAAVWSFLGAGAVGAATVGYAVITSRGGEHAGGVRVVPMVAAGGGGLGLSGRW